MIKQVFNTDFYKSILNFYIPILFLLLFIFFFNNTATTKIYTLSLHDALPISSRKKWSHSRRSWRARPNDPQCSSGHCRRSEEHTSELQSHSDLVCRLLLEKKKHIDLTNAPAIIKPYVTCSVCWLVDNFCIL